MNKKGGTIPAIPPARPPSQGITLFQQPSAGGRDKRDRSRSPRKKDDQPDKMFLWEKLQGIGRHAPPPPESEKPPPPPPKEKKEKKDKKEKKEKPDAPPAAPVEQPKFGWLPEKAVCSYCQKSVADKGGVVCGRKRPDGAIGGCAK